MAVDVASGAPVYTIGRYEIAGHLATGGMAEILLGCMVGPAGFERPVVIKRILPHLARDDHFRNMFLDEARIAARIRHANVVQVHELMEEEGELFIVMEYLEGENLAGLMRRLSKHGETLDPVLCAHVVGEAAAGLHAAHDLTDLEGNPLGLVHRDVSPQNIFITYDGTVKVLDFGIATAADRLSRTETGQLKGKFEYMSPEQCAGKDLDHRSDLFSLGTILWEASTGHRLFKFNNKLLVLKAISDLPSKPPSEVVDEYPAPLEKVVMRALSRHRDDRYQTGEDLRRDLLKVIRKLSPECVPDEELRSVMRRLFQDRIEEKRVMLSRLRSGSELTHLPTPEVDAAVELPTVGDQLVADPSVRPAATDDGVSRIQPTPTFRRSDRRGWIGWIAMAAAALLVAGVAVVLSAGGEPEPAAHAAEAPPPSSAAAEEAPAPAAGPRAEEGAAAEEGTEEESATEPVVEEEPALPQTVVLHVESTPPGVQVLLEDTVRGTTPMDLHVLRGEEALELELRAEEYVTEHVRVTPDLDQRVRVHMTRIEEEEPPPRRRRWRRRPRRTPAQGMDEPERRYHRFE